MNPPSSATLIRPASAYVQSQDPEEQPGAAAIDRVEVCGASSQPLAGCTGLLLQTARVDGHVKAKYVPNSEVAHATAPYAELGPVPPAPRGPFTAQVRRMFRNFYGLPIIKLDRSMMSNGYPDHIPKQSITAPIMRGRDELGRLMVIIKTPDAGQIIFQRYARNPYDEWSDASLHGMPQLAPHSGYISRDNEQAHEAFDTIAAVAKTLDPTTEVDPQTYQLLAMFDELCARNTDNAAQALEQMQTVLTQQNAL